MVKFSRTSSINISLDPRKSIISLSKRNSHPISHDIEYGEDDNASFSSTSSIRGHHLSCSWFPCCMDEDDAETFGHFVSIFMVALIAFATFFCVTLILVLVFLLG